MDDRPDDDGPDSGPPLPPEDRLWRHPSELGAAALGTMDRPGSERRTWPLVGLAALVGAGATLVVVAAVGGLGERVVTRDVVERVAVAPVATLPVATLAPESVGDVAEGVSPAVVRLEIDTGDDDGGHVTGSGVLFRDNGYLLTSAHVVRGSASIDVILASGETHEGELVGSDPLTDIAVVSIDVEDVPTAVLGSADQLAVGDPAVALGSPMALEGGPSLTVGVISALGRTVVPDGDGAVPLHDMIQTDAPIAPGSSGGALLDRRGAVVGITTAVSLDGAGVQGLGFATPIDVARSVANDLIITGQAHHPWLGIEGADVDAETAADLDVEGGAIVQTVAGGSPADRAGLDVDDVITGVGGERIT